MPLARIQFTRPAGPAAVLPQGHRKGGGKGAHRCPRIVIIGDSIRPGNLRTDPKLRSPQQP